MNYTTLTEVIENETQKMVSFADPIEFILSHKRYPSPYIWRNLNYYIELNINSITGLRLKDLKLKTQP